MIRHKIGSEIRRHGVRVVIQYRKENGKAARVHTHAIINIYRRGLERSIEKALDRGMTDAGKMTGKKLVLFMPWDALENYSGKGDVFVTIRGTDYIMQACTSIPFGEEAVYNWMICAPMVDAAVDDYANLGGADDGDTF